MKAIFFMTNCGVASDILLPIIKDVQRAGYDVIAVSQYSMMLFSSEEMMDNNVSSLIIDDLAAIHGDYHLTRSQYLNACGDDVNFVDCLYQQYIEEDYPVTTHHFDTDSWFYQQYYGVAFHTEQVIKDIKPDLILCWHGSNPWSRMIYCKAKKFSIPFMFCETSFFPNSYILDPYGMHFFPGINMVDRCWDEVREQPLDNADASRLHEYIESWKTKRASKYHQTCNPDEMSMLNDLVAEKKKILFYPGQVPCDASVITGLDLFESYDNIIRFLRDNLPDDWLLVHKVHPYNERNKLETGRNGNTLIVKEINIHDLFSIADAVFVHSSTVGLEALLMEKRVISSGRPIYGRDGFTAELNTNDDLQSILDSPDLQPAKRTLLDRFLNFIIFKYITHYGDITNLQEHIELAYTLSDQDSETKGSPFSSVYPTKVKEFAYIIDHFDHVIRNNEWNLMSDNAKQINEIPYLLDSTMQYEQKFISLVDVLLTVQANQFTKHLQHQLDDNTRRLSELQQRIEESSRRAAELQHGLDSITASRTFRLIKRLLRFKQMLTRPRSASES